MKTEKKGFREVSSFLYPLIGVIIGGFLTFYTQYSITRSKFEAEKYFFQENVKREDHELERE